jgi:hypothetical protein
MLRLTALVVTASVVLGTGQAMAAKKHAVSVTGQVAALGTQAGKTIAVGRFLGNLGETVAVFKTKTLANGKLSSTFVAFNAKGTVKGTALQTVTTTSTGGATFSGTAKVTGGTGLYNDATGTLTAVGTQPKGATVISYRLVGSLEY